MKKRIFFVVVVLLGCGQQLTNATITQNFRNFCNERLSPGVGDFLARDDVQIPPNGGSFGGFDDMNYKPQTPSNNVHPVVLVHGFLSNAADIQIIANYYASEEPCRKGLLFGTTWGSGDDPSSQLPPLTDSINCINIQQTRMMILCAYEYANNTLVDVVAHSAGVPIAWKAIAGSACVDSIETFIGDSLSAIVRNFIGIAGANQGAAKCVSFEPQLIPLIGPATGPCNNVTGMTCLSTYLKDIHQLGLNVSGKISVIMSVCDNTIGFLATCATGFADARTAFIPGASNVVELNITGFGHQAALYATPEIQLKMLNDEWTNGTDPTLYVFRANEPLLVTDIFNEQVGF